MRLLRKITGGLAPDTKIVICCVPAAVLGATVSVTIRALTVGRPVLRTLVMAAALYPVAKAGEVLTERMWKEIMP